MALLKAGRVVASGRLVSGPKADADFLALAMHGR